MLLDTFEPSSEESIELFITLLETKNNFSFVRFSDGEIEILRNRYLEINNGKTTYKGREFKNSFPVYDAKRFDPVEHQSIRKELLDSAIYRNPCFYKGIPTLHNDALVDREFMLRLNGGFESNMTFSDLFLNSNYRKYRECLVPVFAEFENIYVIANYRAELSGSLTGATHLPVPDNFFSQFDQVVTSVSNQLKDIEPNSLILSSASSLSNIIAHRLHLCRQDVTFLDVGTSINDLLSLDVNTRAYHEQDVSFFKRFTYKSRKEYQIKW